MKPKRKLFSQTINCTTNVPERPRGSAIMFNNRIIENICSVPSLSSAPEFVCDHQQVPAMKSAIFLDHFPALSCIVSHFRDVFRSNTMHLRLDCDCSESSFSFTEGLPSNSNWVLFERLFLNHLNAMPRIP